MTNQTPFDQNISDLFALSGYAVARQVFGLEEVARLRDHCMKLRTMESRRQDLAPQTSDVGDPLQQYPRLLQMHRWDSVSRDWLLDERLMNLLDGFFQCEALACQSMLYFKPPGARGQALHQDNFYLRVRPGTCIAAWMALDPSDEANGCMQVVPGSHDWPVLCPQRADTTKSFTDVTVTLPPGVNPTPIIMDEGDVLFFNGSLIHGSLPNVTTDRFRRSLIGHYVCERTEYLTSFYQPVLRRDGTELNLNISEEGGPCGVWVDQAGKPVIEMTGQLAGGTALRE